jgi:hypothetical protein
VVCREMGELRAAATARAITCVWTTQQSGARQHAQVPPAAEQAKLDSAVRKWPGGHSRLRVALSFPQRCCLVL